MKIRNKNYKKFRLIPIELDLRNSLSKQFNLDEMEILEKQIQNNTLVETLDYEEYLDKITSKFYYINK